MSEVEIIADALTTSERKRLDELEATISAGFQGFVAAGAALGEIRDSKLYRGTHATFETYCPDVWGLSSRQTYYLIEASSIAALLETRTMVQVPNARVARELAPLADNPEKLIEAWKTAVDHYGTPTAAQVRFVVNPIAHPIDPDAEEVIDDADDVEPRKPLELVPSWTVDRANSISAVTRAVRAAVKQGATTQELYAAYQAGFH